MAQGREYISLSPKLASATYSEGFGTKFNSPKTISAKGFVLPKSNNENVTLLSNQVQRAGPIKSKSIKSSLLLNAGTVSSPKMGIPNGSTTFGIKDEKKALKPKESLRTMSSTPKNSAISKGAEPLRARDIAGANSSQYKWKKLEISTEFNNTKSSYASRPQTTKNTEVDENTGVVTKNSITQQSLQLIPKQLQNRTDGYTISAETKNEQKARSGRPLSSSAVNAKHTSASTPKDGYKATSALLKNSSQENNATRTSYKKNTASTTPKASANNGLVSVEDMTPQTTTGAGKKVDLRASWQASSTTNESAKKRPLSAKKETKEVKEDLQAEKTSSLKTPTEKISLNSFVTSVSKGDAFGSIKKYGEKRESSVKKITKKPTLTLDEKTQPVRAVELELRGSQTTANSDSKTFTISLGKVTAMSPQASTQKNTKNTRTGASTPKDAMRNSQEISTRTKAQAQAQAKGNEPFIYYMTNMEKAHRWNGEPDYFVQVYREHFLQTYQALTFCKMLKPADLSVISQKKVNLPKKEVHNKHKKTLVFDMDETLIHCNESTDMPADVVLPIIFPNGEVVQAGINVRPYALEILRELSAYYEIVVFTASHACYANVVLDYLDPHEQYIQHRLFRDSCVVTEEGVHIKDLRVIGNRNIKDVILIDNAAYSFGFQIENGIPIIPFYDNKADQELRHLIPYLKFLSSVEDLREINRQTFRLHQYAHHDTPEGVLEKIILQE
jgi:CTD small phosphatase-like protein 2